MPLTGKHQATQNFVPIKELQDGIVVLEDGSFRALIMVSTLNIALKSEDERAAVLVQFQNFLNTLDFSIQIFMQSRELNINPYLQMLEEQYKKQENELLKVQINEYIDFIKEYTENVNIMTKAFFIVVPYHPPMVGGKKKKKILGSSKKETKKTSSVDDYRTQLDQRISVVSQGLRRVGLRTVMLEDEEVKELFYNLFNPGEERVGGL
ncbi:MAG: TraC family protein [Candidatus Paceibacterota bacterium]